MHSCIYEGRIRHRRRLPRSHEFHYSLFMMYLDLEELPRLFEGRWFWSVSRPAPARFRREKHLGDPQQPLADEVRRLVARRSGLRLRGPIRLLTHLSYFGYAFNPVSFYFCFDTAASHLEAIVAEINNTPWGEQHCYVLTGPQLQASNRRFDFELSKSFHVSPFLPMDMDYRWRFTMPDEHLNIHLENHRSGELCFDATLILKRRPITGRALAEVLLRFPLMTLKVTAAIYFQAWRLWRKRVPFYSHPDPEKQLFGGRS